MSRFEPNAEPSMEEILASIRRIIAEDASGSRAVPPPAPAQANPSPLRSNAAPKPAAPQQQRGFMSREAFMRSQGAADEPGEQKFFTPVTPQDPLPGADAQAAPQIVAKDRSPAPQADARDVKSPAPAAKVEAPSEPAKSEAKAEAPKADLRESEAKTVLEAEPTALTPEPKSDAQIIDAQLVELLGDDLKALSEPEPRVERAPVQQDDKSSKAEAASFAAKSAEPVAKVNGVHASVPAPQVSNARAPASEAPDAADGKETNDPFAFDLGPSPFLPRPSAERMPERKIAVEPERVPQRPVAPAPAREEPTFNPERGWQRIAATPPISEPARPTAAPSPSPVTGGHPQIATPASARPVFAVPSVSATLGPQRRLEPLSDSFKRETQDYSRPSRPVADPFEAREHGYDRHQEPPFEPRRDPRADSTRLQPAPMPSLSALPPLEASASPDVSGDRTMEDAVADLLRPLLKTWLAENMPKIVERALRREMTERLLPGHKTSHD